MNRVVIATILLLLSLSASASAQFRSSCRKASFAGRINGDEGFSRAFGNNLELHLTPTEESTGWIISVSPIGAPEEDWTHPVTFPLRTRESQYLASGYGESIKEKLQYPHSVRFMLSKADYNNYSQMAAETLSSQDSEAAGRYMAAVQKVVSGLLVITSLNHNTSPEGDKVNWMRFKVEVIVPKSFSGAADLKWSASDCPTPGD